MGVRGLGHPQACLSLQHVRMPELELTSGLVRTTSSAVAPSHLAEPVNLFDCTTAWQEFHEYCSWQDQPSQRTALPIVPVLCVQTYQSSCTEGTA